MNAVASSVCGWLLELLSRSGISEDAWLRDLPVDPAQLRASEQYVDWDVFATLCERLERLLGGPDALREAASALALERFAEAGRRLGGGFTEPTQLYWIAQQWAARTWFPLLRTELAPLPDGRLRLVAALPDDTRPCPPLFRLLESALAAVPRMLDRPAARLTARHHADRAVYTLELPLPDGAAAAPGEPPATARSEILEQIAATACEILYVYDLPKGRFVYLNDAVTALLGYPLEQMRRGGVDFFREIAHPEDLRRADADAAPPCCEGAIEDAEYRVRHADGSWRWLHLRSAVLSRTPTGGIREVLGHARDVTDRRRVEEERRRSDDLYRRFAELASDISVCLRTDAEGRQTVEWLSGSFERITGYPPGEISFDNWREIIHPDDQPIIAQRKQAPREGLQIEQYRIRSKSGEVRWVRERSFGERHPDGSYVWYAACQDITDAKRAQDAQTLSEDRFRAIAESSRDLILETDGGGTLLFVSPNARDVLGRSPEELTGSSAAALIHPRDRSRIEERLSKLIHTGGSESLSFRLEHGDRGWRGFESTATAFHTAGGEARCTFVARDITERLEAERERQRLVSLVESSSELVAVLSTDGKILFLNRAGQHLLGFESEAELRGITLFECLTPEDAERTRFHALPEVLRRGQWRGEYQLRHSRTGRSIATLATLSAIAHEPGTRPESLALLARDISARVEAERALQESEERFRTLVENAYDLVTEQDPSGRILYVSPSVGALLGYAPEDLLGADGLDFLSPDDLPRVKAALGELAEGAAVEVPEHRVRHRDGSWRWIESHVRTFAGADGQPLVVSTSRDVTARRRAEEALRESEERLRQSQKMEAIGRLAGGVAHDFNNLLTAITGYGDLLLEALGPDHPLRADAEEVLRAAERAGALTRQLLAVSRRQPLEPRPTDLNALVADVDRLLRRLIGEDVELVASLEGALHTVLVDPGQMEQLLMNLAVNARDAMPRGGRLTISTENVEIGPDGDPAHPGILPGVYASLRVRDTGIGMDAETLSHVFEPFFTTKPPGKGTGLGLSTVYGVVQQSGGQIHAESEPGSHTAFTVYLPRVEGQTAPAEPEIVDVELRGSESVLVVEDEEPVRRLLRRVLTSHGYRVLDAATGLDALRLLKRSGERVELLVADVVLPKMDGRELSRRLSRDQPDMKTVYISGFSDDALAEHGALDPGLVLVEKPFAPAALLRAMREVLGPRPAEGG